MRTAPTSETTNGIAAAGAGAAGRAIAITGVVTAAVNLALWRLGRAAGASFVVDPALGEPNTEVGGLKVIVTTLLPLATGVLLLALAARRSGRWVTTLGVAGVALAVASALGPLEGAHDTTTGVLLATMHLTTGAAFLVAATRLGAWRRIEPGTTHTAR